MEVEDIRKFVCVTIESGGNWDALPFSLISNYSLDRNRIASRSDIRSLTLHFVQEAISVARIRDINLTKCSIWYLYMLHER